MLMIFFILSYPFHSYRYYTIDLTIRSNWYYRLNKIIMISGSLGDEYTMTSTNSSLVVLEAILQKVTQSASGLKSFLENLQSCQRLSHAVHRHVIHCSNFLSNMRKTSAYLKAVGAATKVTGGLFAAASVMSHSDLLRKLGSKMWKIGKNTHFEIFCMVQA